MDEVSIVNGVLLTAERSVSEAMITMDKVRADKRCCRRSVAFTALFASNDTPP